MAGLRVFLPLYAAYYTSAPSNKFSLKLALPIAWDAFHSTDSILPAETVAEVSCEKQKLCEFWSYLMGEGEMLLNVFHKECLNPFVVKGKSEKQQSPKQNQIPGSDHTETFIKCNQRGLGWNWIWQYGQSCVGK